MANTYTQIHLQLVFAVKFRRAVISKSWRTELYKYVCGIIMACGHKPIIVNGVEDHIHILMGYRPTQALSPFVQEFKKSTTKWINERRLVQFGFAWQEGFSAFSYSMRDLPVVIRYIERQEEHHRERTFKEECVRLLKDFEVEYDERYIFKDLI